MQGSQGGCHRKYCGRTIAKVRNKKKKAYIDDRAVQQTQIEPKYNKNATLLRRLSSLYIWKQHRIRGKKKIPIKWNT